MIRDPAEPAPEPDDRPVIRRSIDDEVAEEFEFHLQMRTRELVAHGLDPAEARRQAEARFADLAGTMKECHTLADDRERQVRRTRYLDELGQDIRFALRTLSRRATFAAVAIGTMGLGIGAATAIYGVVDGVLLRPLPFAEPDRLVAVWVAERGRLADPVLARGWDRVVLGAEEYDGLRQHATRLREVSLFASSSALLTNGLVKERVPVLRVTSSLLPLLRVHPALGRGILPGEDVLNGPRIALLSWEQWQSRFGGDSTIIGRSIGLDERTYTVVGVLPRGLRLDRTVAPAAVWVPALQEPYDQADRHNRSYNGVARLASGAGTADAAQEAGTIFRGTGPSRFDGVGARITDWQADQTRDVRGSLLLLLGAVGLLLLIACVNVATLMLGETAKRQPELAARAALGAGTARLARQLLTESLVISALGAVLGCGLAWAGTRALVAFAPPQIARLGGVGLDWRMLAFAISCAVLTGIGFGLVPALTRMKPAHYATLRTGSGQTGRGTRIPERLLIACEVALSLILLVGCTLLGRSLDRLTAVDPGFAPEAMLVARIVSQDALHSDSGRAALFYAAGLRELAALPGVLAVSASAAAPFAGGTSSSPTRADSRPDDLNTPPVSTQQRTTLPGFFETMKIPLVAGRDFTAADREGAPLVVVLSESAARRDWPSQSAVGHRIFWQGQWRTVIGVVGDVKYARLSREDEPTLYAPYAQYAWEDLAFVIRTSAKGTELAAAVRQRLNQLDPAATALSVDPMTSLIERSYAEERYRTVLVSLFGIMASALAAVGMFGVISRAIARRTREVGIRLALGSPSAALVGLMLRDTLIGLGLGVLVGLPAAVLIARLLTPYLFGVTPSDPTAFLVALGLLAGATLAATLPPARRANRVDPALVLRADC